VTGVADHVTGPITSLTVFYLIPVVATAWVAGQMTGNALALFAAATWAVADRLGPYAEPKVKLAYWNDISIVALFIFINAVVGILRNELRHERGMLQDVQRRLMPMVSPAIDDAELAWRWEPAWTVAGDYYDVIDAGRGRWALCLADVSGKGMPAALIMSNVQATVHALTAEGLPPERVVSGLNELLVPRVRRESFVTMFYGVYDSRSGDLVYVNAGQNPPLFQTSSGVTSRLEPTGPVAGMFQGARYTAKTVSIQPGDALVVYSDGVTEYENAPGEEFGEGRLREVIGRTASQSAEDICTAVISSLQNFGNGRPYGDDVTLVVLSRRKGLVRAANPNATG
jgi:phosphoserine phosphatase RsbU/P